jgi:hypothetical protein
MNNMKTFLHLLETTDKPKTNMSLYNDGAFCAIGLCAHELLGVPVEAMVAWGENNDAVYAKVSGYLGIPDHKLWYFNDTSDTFKDVARRLRLEFGVRA